MTGLDVLILCLNVAQLLGIVGIVVGLFMVAAAGNRQTGRK